MVRDSVPRGGDAQAVGVAHVCELAGAPSLALRRLTLTFVAVLIVATSVMVTSNANALSTTQRCQSARSCVSFSSTIGVVNANEPSGMAPPLVTALSGFRQSYVTDFSGNALPTGWSPFLGVPGGNNGTEFAPSQVTVSNGLLQLNAAYDATKGEWLTGGTCLCQLAQTYGAYFVRSRMTGPGPTLVELLWPSANSWPPEIDFNETYGGTTTSMATVHFTSSNHVDHRTLAIDMTQWHTWGVVWTPQTITYVVDGRVWGVVALAVEIPSVPMTLDIEQETWCAKNFACPIATQSSLVDWAVEYSRSTAPPVNSVLAPKVRATQIPIDIYAPSYQLSAAVQVVATTLGHRHSNTVTVDATLARASSVEAVTAAIRVRQLVWMLNQDTRQLGLSTPKVYIHWSRVNSGTVKPLSVSLVISP